MAPSVCCMAVLTESWTSVCVYGCVCLRCGSTRRFLNESLVTASGIAQCLNGHVSNVTSAATCGRNAPVGRTRSSVPTPPVDTEGSARLVVAISVHLASTLTGRTPRRNVASSGLKWLVWRHRGSGLTSCNGFTSGRCCLSIIVGAMWRVVVIQGFTLVWRHPSQTYLTCRLTTIKFLALHIGFHFI